MFTADQILSVTVADRICREKQHQKQPQATWQHVMGLGLPARQLLHGCRRFRSALLPALLCRAAVPHHSLQGFQK